MERSLCLAVSPSSWLPLFSWAWSWCMPDALEPLSRTIHADALASLYGSLAEYRAKLRFLADHWNADAETVRRLSVKVDNLRTVIDYHQQCYDLCPSCDD